MIEITCDRCERVVAVAPELAGRKIECPHCGDINRVPEASGGAARLEPEHSAGPVESPVAATAKAPGDPDAAEHDLLVTHPTLWRKRPITTLLAAIGGPALTITGLTLDWPVGMAVWLALDAAIWLLYGLWWLRATRLIRLRVTTERTIMRVGLLSRSTSEVLHRHVRSIKVQQSLHDRLFNIGSIAIDGSAGGDTAEIRIDNIPRPGRLKSIIDERRSRGA